MDSKSLSYSALRSNGAFLGGWKYRSVSISYITGSESWVGIGNSAVKRRQ